VANTCITLCSMMHPHLGVAALTHTEPRMCGPYDRVAVFPRARAMYTRGNTRGVVGMPQ
jgi:hypothetical protein